MAQQYELTNGQIVSFNNDGIVAGGAKLYVYVAGTTTPLDTYSDSGLTTPNANPVVADANGRFPAIFLAVDDYKFVCKSSDDATTFFTVDDYEVLSEPVYANGIVKSGNTVQLASAVNNQTGTSYTIQASDWGKLISFSNANPIAVTLPAASVTFPDGFYFRVANRNDGVVTITSSSNLDGKSDLVLNRNEGATVASDGSTYYIEGGVIRDVVYKDGGELTISTGEVTVDDKTYFTIDTESDAASDDLDTINGEFDGKVITIAAQDASRTVVVKHNTGNIYNPFQRDINLEDVYSNIVLRYEADLSRWVVISQSAADVVPIFTEEYVSSATAYTNGTAVTFTHGLSSVPKIIQVDAVCVTTEGGYAADDTIRNIGMSGDATSSPSTNFGLVAYIENGNTTEIKVRASSNGVSLGHKTTGANFTLTPANWNLIVRAYS